MGSSKSLGPGLAISFIMKPLVLMTTLIVTGFHYKRIKDNGQAGEVIHEI